MIRFLFVFFCPLFALSSLAQQTIRGTVLESNSNTPVPWAAVTLLGQQPPAGTSTDTSGNFVLNNITLGRYDIKVTCLGYEPVIVREITITSARQTVLTIKLRELVTSLDTVVITPKTDKEQPLNNMALVSARMLSVEEAKRFAGGFDDPARLASAFAGVTSGTDVNGITVRGNAPKFLQWKMEGIEIPNPNHFGDLKSVGGGTLTALSSQMLANSDFFTGAFPAEYNNALSGVFDIALRKGNNQQREHTFQAGITGIDFSSEGPFRKNHQSSYLFNYRYATLALVAPLLPEDAGGIKYQDLSFKLNFPSKKAGVFSLWGIGLLDGALSREKTDTTAWVYADDKEHNQITVTTGVTGLTHRYFFNPSASLKTTLAATVSNTGWTTSRLNSHMTLDPFSKISYNNNNYIFSSCLNKKFGRIHTNRTGILVTGMTYDLLLNRSLAENTAPVDIVNASGFSTLLSAYSSSAISLNNSLLLTIGINAQYFTLNGHYTIEPRAAIRKSLGHRHAIALAYGLHSRIEKLNFYLNNTAASGEKAVNRNLDFTKAHHFVFSYDWNISDLVHLKAEPYYQFLFSVPVEAGTSFSMINLQTDWFFAEKLENTGQGKNYGLDLTLEKFMSKGFYFLTTASLFKSSYKGGDGTWRNSRYNRNYAFNFLVGKEWKTGKPGRNILGLNIRLSYQGGVWYLPVDETASLALQQVVQDESKAFSRQSPAVANVHFTASYRMNKTRSSHEIALKILNLTGQPDFYGFRYNYRNNTVDKDLSSVIIPNLSYKIEF